MLAYSFNRLNAQNEDDNLYNSAIVFVYDNPDKAIEIGQQLLKKNEKNPKAQIRALLLISNAYASKRDYEKSLSVALKAKEIAVKLKNPEQEFGILIKIAAQYHALGVNDKALEILDESDKLYQSIKQKDSMLFDMGSNYAIKGFIYSNQLSCDIAIEYFNKAMRTYSASKVEGAKINMNQSVVSYNKGNCFITLNQLDSARINFLNSKQLASKSDANSLEAFSMKGLAEVYTLESNYSSALTELNKADSLAGKVGDLELNSGIYRGLADNYLALKDWSNFQKYDRKYNETIGQIKLSERNTINNIIQDYNVEIVKKEKSTKLFYLILISVFALVSIILIFSIIKSEIIFRKKFGKIKSEIKV